MHLNKKWRCSGEKGGDRGALKERKAVGRRGAANGFVGMALVFVICNGPFGRAEALYKESTAYTHIIYSKRLGQPLSFSISVQGATSDRQGSPSSSRISSLAAMRPTL